MNFFLDRGALLVADRIQKSGFRSLAVAASQIVDWDKQRAHLSHKHVGRAAGLGWFGRNNLLVNPELGSRFRLVTVLTDMPLEPDRAARPRLRLLPCLRRRVPGPGHQGHPGGLRPSGLLRDAQGFPQEGLHDPVHLRHLRARLPRPEVGPGPIRASGDSGPSIPGRRLKSLSIVHSSLTPCRRQIAATRASWTVGPAILPARRSDRSRAQ